jgi:hypothetical protein
MSADSEALQAILIALGYDTRWLAYGFVDGPFLQQQALRFISGADPHTEHYRWAGVDSV